MTSQQANGAAMRGPFRLAAAALILVLSATGFLLLLFTEDLAASGSSLDDLSSSGDFLERDAAAELRGLDRLTYQIGDESVVIPNRGTIPLSDELLLQVEVSPYPPTSFDLDVLFFLSTVAGEPITDAEIATIWDMTLMYHGPFETQFTNAGGGRYAAFFDLFMVGPWGLELDIAVPTYHDIESVSLIVYVWPE
jgi:hypothetical protein